MSVAWRIEERDSAGKVLRTIDEMFERELDKASALSTFDYEVATHPQKYAWCSPTRLVVIGPDHAFMPRDDE